MLLGKRRHGGPCTAPDVLLPAFPHLNTRRLSSQDDVNSGEDVFWQAVAGSYTYICPIHPAMTGTITVVPA